MEPKTFFDSLLDKIEESKREIVIFLIGLLFLGSGFVLSRMGMFGETKIEILDTGSSNIGLSNSQIIVEIGGAVENPGVYTLNTFDRVDTALIAAGGLAADADRDWVAKNLNRAAKLVDGQKIYIPSVGMSAGQIIGVSVGQININTASQQELESLPGIGPARAQAIITNRPYSSADELLSKKVIPNNVYQKIKEKLTY